MTQGFFFLVFVVIVAILLLQWLLSAARRQDVGPRRTRGMRIAAVVSKIAARSSESPPSADTATPITADQWYLECQWTDPRSEAVYTFRSDDLDAATVHAYAIGSPIAVLIAPGNPDSYFVEVVEP